MKRNRWQLLLLLLVALAFALAGCGGDDDEEGGGGDGDTTAEGGGAAGGGTVSILSLWGGAEREAFQKVLDGFTQETGIQTKYESARDFEPVIRTRLAAGNPPDMAIVPRPGVMVALAQEGSLKSFEDLGIDESVVSDNYSQAWIDLGTVDDQIYGIAAKANSKSVVWFNPSSLQELGIEPPETWDELLAATDKIREGGAKKPWAVGAKDSWTLTDWFENIYVRQAGPEMYEQLFSGELEFTDQSVKDALTEMTKVLNNENLPGGVQAALGTAFTDSIGQVFGKNPKAELYMEGGFVGGIAIGDVNPDLVPGETIDFVPFPTINEEHGSPLVGGGDLAVAFNDSDGAKQLMEYLMTKEAGETWAATGAIVSPNKSVDISVYPNELTQKEAEQVVNAEVFRFDGSDLLPGALAEDWGALLQNVIRNPNQMDRQLEDFQSTAEGEFA
jgi:ABC-type glycerol-3-phosphate transport system substrate-binding protein